MIENYKNDEVDIRYEKIHDTLYEIELSNLSNKKISLKVFLFFSLLFIICISCTNFSPQGGWSNVVKDTNQEEYYVISDEGRLFQIQFNDQIPMINWSYPECP